MAVDAARVKSLFLAASDLDDLAERAAYLERECGGDAELRARVEALLRANDAAPLPAAEAQDGTSAHIPGGPQQTVDHGDPTARIGSIIAGKYKLIEEIGEGGMGSVYLAQQTEPVRRAVAVKVIKAGMDSKAVLARFEAERQALAMMDHPNIAKVLDAGTTDGGRPFFVMELVKGQPITKYCDELKLTPRQRLELFVPVCQAIQHAHQKGVIHRDIKPSNVLVAMYDDRPVPKVIDFGVAKAAGQTLTDKTLMTGLGAIVGTAEYMSPEQANLNNLDIDTRSDVYSLGVLLYELLTGTTPVDKKSLGKAALLEILRVVREVEVPRPSAKLSTIGTLPSVAANRGTEPAKLSKLMKGELDWLVLKALEKDRTRRYETANALSRDIQRYLADEIVEARPPSAGYRLKKFVRRHKGQVLAAVTVAVALLAGVAAVVTVQVRANRDLAAKNAELADEQAKVQARFDMAVKAIETFHTGVSEDALLKNAEFKELRTRLLKEAAGFYADLEKLLAGQTDAKSRKALAAGYFQLAELTDKIGDRKEALALHHKALAVRRELAAAEGADVETRLDVTRSLYAVGNLLRRTDPAEALSAFQEVRDLAAALEVESPTDAVRVQLAIGHNGIGFALDGMGKLAETLDSYRKALAIYQKLPEAGQYPQPGYGPTFGLQLQAGTYMSIGSVLSNSGKVADGLESLRTASDILEKLAKANPANNSVQEYLADSYNRISYVLRPLGKPAEAVEASRKALAICQKLADNNPAVTSFQARLATSMTILAGVLTEAGRNPEAIKLQKETIQLQKVKLGPDDPATLGTMVNLASSYKAEGRLTDAIKLLEEVLPVMKAKMLNHEFTFNCMNNLAGDYADTGRAEEALKLFEEVFQLRKVKLGPDHPRTLENMMILAGRYVAAGRTDEALKLSAEGLPLLKAKMPEDPGTWGSVVNLANNYKRLGRFTEAIELLEVALPVMKAKMPNHQFTFICMGSLANSYAAAGRLQQALKLREEEFGFQKAKLGSDHPDTLGSLVNLALVYYSLGRHTDAIKLYEEALPVMKVKMPDDRLTFTCMDCLAIAYREAGRAQEARKLHEEVLQLRKARFGPDDLDTLGNMVNLAVSYRSAGRLADAIKLLEEALPVMKAKLPDHEFTFNCRICLASAYGEAGRAQEALNLTEETLKLTKSKLGANHPNTVASIYHIACVHAVMIAKAEDRGKQADLAMDWLQQAVAAGYKDVAHMKKDTDLDPLRGREDFKKLLADLEKASPPAKPAPQPKP
jgi:serine/threonine protein kinase/tetratricopeptide (TPR) repeat protein